MKIKDILRLSNGRLVSGNANLSVDAGRISTDTRKIGRGDLFVALKGDNFDGDKFLGAALASGAMGAIVHKSGSVIDSDKVVIESPDTL